MNHTRFRLGIVKIRPLSIRPHDLGQIKRDEMVDPKTIARAMDAHMRADIARNGGINVEYLTAVVEAVKELQKELQAKSEDAEPSPVENKKPTLH